MSGLLRTGRSTGTRLRTGRARAGRPLQAYFALLVALFVAAAAAAAVFVHVQARRDARREAERDARFAARTAAKQLGGDMALLKASVASLAANPQIGATIEHPAGCTLAYGSEGHIDLLRTNGTAACSSRPHAKGAQLSGYRGAAWVRAANRGPVFLAPVADAATGTRVALSAAPVPGHGIVAGFADLRAAGPHLVSLYGGGRPVEFLVASADGRTVLARSIAPARWVGASLAGTAFSRGRGKVERPDLDGRSRYYAESAVPGVGWRFYVGEDKSAALAAGRRLENRQLAIILAGLAVVLLGTLLAYRRVAEPIKRLGFAVRSSAATTPRLPVPSGGPAEVEALAGAINGLIVSVNEELLERRRTDAALRESEARSRAMLGTALDAIVTIDEHGSILEFNPAAERMFGRARDHVLGKQMAALLIPPSLRESHHRGFERLLATGEGPILDKRLELTALRADGSEFPIELAITKVAVDGQTLFTGYLRDISERKDAERAVHQLASIVEFSDDAIVSLGLDGTILSWNAGAERLYGYDSAEVVGRPLSLLVPPDQSDELEKIAEQLRRGQTVHELETTRLRKDGSPVDVSLTFSPMRGADGAIVGGSVVARDISTRIRTEQALRRSEESYRLLFERHPAPMWLFDPETLRFLAVNETAVATYGYSHEEFLAMTIAEIRPAEDREALQEAVGDAERGRVEAGVWRHRRKDGTLIDVLVSSNAIEFEGRPARLVLAQDVTEQRRVEEQLRQAQKMEAIGNLAGGVAHDFNNILMVIRTCGALLLRRLEDEQLRSDVVQIDSAAQRAAALTHQLLAFSRQQVLHPEATDLNAVVDETLVLLHRLIGEDIDIVCALEPRLQSIVVDRGQLAQVILNLAVNARDAMPGGGTVTIRTANVVLDEIYASEHAEVVPGPYALLQVTDSGVGMDEETKERVFDPFFTTKDEGTGLGLATVYGIVKQSEGHIWLYSERGMGTTFKVYFPAAAVPVGSVPPPTEVASLEGEETILLVEDEEAVRPLVAEALRAYGYTVLEASSGADAIGIAERERGSIDLLLTDVVMPGMNGRELAEELLAGQPELKVLFTSGYPADTIVRHGIARAGAAYLEKPYVPDDLAHKIREVLDESPAR